MGTLRRLFKTGFGDRNGYKSGAQRSLGKTKIYQLPPALLNNSRLRLSATIMLQESLVFHGIQHFYQFSTQILQDIMRKDAGVDWPMSQRLASVSPCLLFLKIFEGPGRALETGADN